MKYIKRSLIVFIILLMVLFGIKSYVSTRNFRGLLTSILNSSGLNVEFTDVRLIGFNKIQVDNLKVKDNNGNVVIDGKRTTAGISLLMPTRLSRIDVYDGIVNLERRKDNDFNIFHVLKTDPKKVQTYDPTSRIGKLYIHNAILNYTDTSFSKKISKTLTKVNGNLETSKSRGFSLMAKGSGNENEDGTTESLKIELGQIIKSKQSIFSMFDKIKNSDESRKEFHLSFDFENVAVTEELGQYVPLDMIAAKGGILNGKLSIENDKVKKTTHALGNLEVKNGKISYVDFDGDIEGANAVIDLKKDKITVNADAEMSGSPVSFILGYLVQDQKLNMKLIADRLPFKEVARYKLIKEANIKAEGQITGNMEVNVDTKAKKTTLDGKFESDNIKIANYNFRNIKTSMKIADEKLILDNSTFVFNEVFSGFRVNEDVRVDKFVYDLKNKTGTGNYVLQNIGSDFDIKTITGNANISSKNIITGTVSSNVMKGSYTVDPKAQTVVVNADSSNYFTVNYGGQKYVVNPDVQNLLVKFNEKNILRSGQINAKIKDLSIPLVNNINAIVKINNGNYNISGTAGINGGGTVSLKGTTTADMKHSYSLNLPRNVDIAKVLRANGYNFKGLDKAKLPAQITAQISGSGDRISGTYSLYSAYGEYIAEYENLHASGKINNLAKMDLTVDANMDEVWLGYQRLKNVSGNLRIKDNIVTISNLQNENLTANGNFNMKSGRMAVNAELKDYMLYNTSIPKVNMKIGTLNADLSGTVDKLSGKITLPSAPTTINSIYVGDTNAHIDVNEGVINLSDVTLRENSLSGTYDLKTGISDVQLSLVEPDIPKLLNMKELSFGTRSNLNLKGDLNKFNLSGQVILGNMSFKGYKIPSIVANLEYSDGDVDRLFKYGTFDLQNLKFVGDNRETLFETQTKFDLADVNIDYRLENQKFSLDSVQDLKEKGYSGDIDFSAMYRGSFENFVTGVQIKSDELKLSGFPVKNVDIDLQASEKTLNIGQFYLEYEDNPLLVNGYVQFIPVKYDVSMLAKDFNLDFLGINKDVEQAGGIANIDAIFSNNSTTGHIILDNFNYKTKDKMTLVDNINANIDLQNNKLLINRLDGGYNGGTFKVSGDLDVPTIPDNFMQTKRLELGKFELNATLDKVGLHYGKGIDFAVTGEAVFTENRLFGNLTVDNAEIREIPDFNSNSEGDTESDLSEDTSSKSSQDKTIVEGIVEEVIDKILKQYTVALNVQTGDHVKLNIPNISLVRNIKGTVKGGSEISYNGGEIGIDGEYTITGGSFSLNGKDFKINSAEIRFVPAGNVSTSSISNPFVIFEASTMINGDRIEVNVTGNVSNPNIKFSSTSGKSREEIVSLLAFDTIVGSRPRRNGLDNRGQENTEDGMVVASSLVNTALNELIFSSVTDRIRNTLGLSKVSVSTNLNSSNVNNNGTVASTTLTLQDNLYKDRLFWNVAVKFPYQSSKAEEKEPLGYNGWLSYSVTNGLDLRLGGDTVNRSRTSANLNNGTRVNYYFGVDFSTRADTFGDILKKIFKRKKLDTLKK